jgi:2-iminobutanoate/2-iminopropanoate deaminase
MSKTRTVQTAHAPAAIGPYSQAIVAGGFVFCSGQIAIDPQTNTINTALSISAQTQRVMDNLAAVLSAAGTSLDHVVRTTIFLADMADFAAVNEVYAKYFNTKPPARATVAVKDLPKGAKVEIDAIAILP